MSHEISIIAIHVVPQEVKNALEKVVGATSEVSFQLRETSRHVRGLDPTILVAIVGAAGTALGTLIGGLLKVAQDKGSQNIIIVGRQGSRIEVPADTNVEMIAQYVDIAKNLDIDRIQF